MRARVCVCVCVIHQWVPTWAWGLDLGLVLLDVRVEEVGGRVLSALHLALEGVQTLDVLLLQRAGRAARRAHVQVGGQLPPLLVLVHLGGAGV